MGFLKLGLGTIGAAAVLGSIPNVSGTSAETNIKTNTAKGLENIGSTFPTQGKLIGAGLVLKQTKKLSKATKRLY